MVSCQGRGSSPWQRVRPTHLHIRVTKRRNTAHGRCSSVQHILAPRDSVLHHAVGHAVGLLDPHHSAGQASQVGRYRLHRLGRPRRLD